MLRSAPHRMPRSAPPSSSAGVPFPRPPGEGEMSPITSTPRLEPVEEDAIEGIGALDIGEVARVGDLLVAAAGDELGNALVAGRWRSLVVGAADDERRHLQLRQRGEEVEILDRRGAAEEALRGGTDDRVA